MFLAETGKLQHIVDINVIYIYINHIKTHLTICVAGQCRDQELTGYTTGSTLYTSPGFERDRQYDYIGYVNFFFV